MKLNPPRRDWFFPIGEAPVLVMIIRSSAARNVMVPHKKALIAADTGDIMGLVGAGLKVFTARRTRRGAAGSASKRLSNQSRHGLL
jgi:hypothetical protein